MIAVHLLPCLDGPDLAAMRRRELDLPRDVALEHAHETLEIVRAGRYRAPSGREVAVSDAVAAARRTKVSLAPDAALPTPSATPFNEMRVQVTNETTTGAARRLLGANRTVALNFANGVHPGGGFLRGARAQEESLCRASALYETLAGDPMYEAHARTGDAATSSSSILSPEVPFFRDDAGALLEEPFSLSILTCAAPVAFEVGSARAADLLRARIERVLTIMAAYRYEAVVLGAWGCGAFGNDPRGTAADFRAALLGPFRGNFREVVFAVTDWSPERRFLGPFRDAFAA
jgi:uncharacterized protein (TIGR02452 family)